MNLKAQITAALVLAAAAATSATAAPDRHDQVSALLAGPQNEIAYTQFRRGGFRHGFRGRGYYGRGFYGRPYYGRRYYRRGYGGAVIGGLAAGALIGGALAAQAQPAPIYGAVPGDAAAACVERFKSYDPASGTYLGYDGQRHSCP